MIEKDICWGQRPFQNPRISLDPHPSPPSCPEDDLRRSRRVRAVRVGFQAAGRSRPHRSRRPGPRWPLTRLHHPGRERQATPSSPAGVSSTERTTRAPAGPQARLSPRSSEGETGTFQKQAGSTHFKPSLHKIAVPHLVPDTRQASCPRQLLLHMEKAALNSLRAVPGFPSKAVTLTRKENTLLRG